MDLTGDILRGHTDAIILSILARGDSYGYKINYEISEMTYDKFMLTEATLYTAFKRLEKSEFITSYWAEGINNTKRKYYSLTSLGKAYLDESKVQWQNVQQIINKFLGG